MTNTKTQTTSDCDKLDKRTNAYKKCIEAKLAKKANLGLGDVIEDIAKKTGIKKAVKYVFGDDCGCEERKKKLNKIKLPIRVKAKRCFNEDQYKAFKEYRERRTLKRWSQEDIQLLVDLYAHVFALQYNVKDLCINCAGSAKLLLKLDEHLETVYNSYEK